jgi:MFS family permease
MLLTGRLWCRVGWWMLPIGGLLFAVAMLGPIFATSPLTLGVALLFVGAGSGSLDVAMNAAISDIEADSGRRLMFGAHAMFSLAVLVAAVATGLAREFGAQSGHVLGTVSLFAAAVALGTIGTARTRRSTPPVAPETAPGVVAGTGALAFLAALCAAAFLVEDAVQNWSALHIEGNLGAGPALGGAAPGIFAGAMFIGRLLGQRLGDRYGERLLLSGGALGAAAGTAVLAIAPSPAIALVGLAVAGAGISLVAPALFARAGRLANPAGRGAAIARVTALGYTGFIIGPALVGLIAQAIGLPAAIGTLSVLSLVVAVGGWLIMSGDKAADGTFEEGEELLKTSRG